MSTSNQSPSANFEMPNDAIVDDVRINVQARAESEWSPTEKAGYAQTPENEAKMASLMGQNDYIPFTQMKDWSHQPMQWGERYCMVEENWDWKCVDEGKNSRQVIHHVENGRHFTFHPYDFGSNYGGRMVRIHAPNVGKNLSGFRMGGSEDVTFSPDSVSSCFLFRPAGVDNKGMPVYSVHSNTGNAWDGSLDGGGAWWVDYAIKRVGLDNGWEWRINADFWHFNIKFARIS